jgi:glycyl-tRNA synthetase beta subunit
MTQERFEQICATASEMAAEIEWAEFPALTSNHTELREITASLAADPECQLVLRDLLRQMSERIRWLVDALPGRQEVELEAAGLVQSAFKAVLLQLSDLAGVIRPLQMLTKFRRLPEPVLQAPVNARVPSIAEQRERVAAGRAPIDLV